MRIKLVGLFIIFICITIQSVHGQWDAQMSQYWRAKTYYNPSFAGENDQIDNTLMHRQQWLGVDDAPKTSIAMMNMPFYFLEKRHGSGILMFSETIGLYTNTIMSGQYSYRFDIKKKGLLNIGIQAGMTNVDFDASKIHIPESEYHEKNDEAIPTGTGDRVFDASVGISWITSRYWVGLSASHILQPAFELDDNHSSYISRTYYLMGGYNIILDNPLYILKPSAFIKADAVVFQMDITARMEYKRMFNGGISWRKDDGFVFLLGIKIKNFDACYSYDLSTSAIGRASRGSHELSICYSIPLHKKTARSSQKSVRIL